MAFGQLRTPISVVRSTLYAGSSSRILTDPTGERRNRQFRQRFPGLRSCRPNPSGESGFKDHRVSLMQSTQQYRDRAERVRRLAEEVVDQDLRCQLHIIAQDYDDLARSAASCSGYGIGTDIAEIEGMNNSRTGSRR